MLDILKWLPHSISSSFLHLQTIVKCLFCSFSLPLSFHCMVTTSSAASYRFPFHIRATNPSEVSFSHTLTVTQSPAQSKFQLSISEKNLSAYLIRLGNISEIHCKNTVLFTAKLCKTCGTGTGKGEHMIKMRMT